MNFGWIVRVCEEFACRRTVLREKDQFSISRQEFFRTNFFIRPINLFEVETAPFVFLGFTQPTLNLILKWCTFSRWNRRQPSSASVASR